MVWRKTSTMCRLEETRSGEQASTEMKEKKMKGKKVTLLTAWVRLPIVILLSESAAGEGIIIMSTV